MVVGPDPAAASEVPVEAEGEAGADAEREIARMVENAAVRLLGHREHGRLELARKLIGKGHARDVVDVVVGRLAELELVSDERFAEVFIRSRVAKGQGPLRIRSELRDRGIEDRLVDEVLTETGAYWRDCAERARCKRFGDADPDSRDTWARQARFLSQRGYPGDVIYRVLGELD